MRPLLAILLTTLAAAQETAHENPWEAAADYSAGHQGHALLVRDRDGTILFERYETGWDADTPHMLASGTKSFTGVAAMCAVEEGLIALDEVVSETLVEWAEDDRAAITVRDLLSLSSGLQPAPRNIAPGQGGRRAADTYQAVLATRLVGKPGGQFAYGPAHYLAFGSFLQRKLREADRAPSLAAWYDEVLLGPLGLDSSLFHQDQAGNIDLAGYAELTARDWSRFGLCVLRDGVPLDGETALLPPERLEECFAPSRHNPAYGLTWWLLYHPRQRLRGMNLINRALSKQLEAPLREDGSAVRGYVAAGAKGQLLVVLPDDGLVITRFGDTPDREMSLAELLRLGLGLP